MTHEEIERNKQEWIDKWFGAWADARARQMFDEAYEAGADKFGTYIYDILVEDVADALRFLRSHGLLGSFLTDPEVLGDQGINCPASRSVFETFRQNVLSLGDRRDFIVSFEGDSVTFTSLTPCE
jgi:hypothetical protein